MIGHELGGRYQIIERIGGGGMALVYRAQDLLLNRNVAIKVLRQQFVHDEEFIRRFRREAQSAASLSHPNVVSIYDVGQEEDTHYIVMEYVEGQNLNEIIKERAPLQVDEAIRIASQICDALDHAHHNQIIHRDIKPHNILIGRNGRVKVTDFGIARAVTSTTITQTGSVVGSVHYFSPEHAKGVAAGEKSDLYSLGIVLYQMLTGHLPFLGESPISVALKHLQEEFEEPRRLNPMIPQSVENIILKSMRKNPNERYQSAKEMQLDLETCLLPERRTETKIAFDDMDEDSTRIIPAIKPQSKSSGVRRTREEEAPVPEPDSSSKGKKNRKKPAMWAGIVLVVIAILLGLTWYFNKMFIVPTVTVPKVIGLTEDQARAKLAEVKLEVGSEIKREYKEDVAPGTVYEQSKPEGSEVKEGSTIEISVASEKPTVKMPPLTGITYEEARQKLLDLGVKAEAINRVDEFSDQTEGNVTAQNPAADADIDADTVSIQLTVSKGKATVAMDDLSGKTVKEAKAAIEKLGLKLANDGIEEQSSYSVEKGKVMDQWPYKPGDSAEPGTEVKITVSSGYPADAITYSYGIPVAPAESGKNSKIRIVYSDATGDNKDWGTKSINTLQTLSVDLVLDPKKDGYVSIFRDGQQIGSLPVSYIDAKQGTVPVPELPGTAQQEQDEKYTEPDNPDVDNPDDVTGMVERQNNELASGNGNATAEKARSNNKGKGHDKKKDN
ncbi:Stk1 family PASTA domain-containing Ser/Thr kinase [Paenibacillus sp. CAA11]|uniref:Stk1 family PASTA domain-containing Ser/Thr kinase n=1 Tax=Paenibacillus sp. CAA11 TaxID=1532905 RepID=UPI000D363034|nr:Stk1 family PASTA domain-containing Ser/Thr kinase [Paenibacillus sp. CAA11]AWB45161.1 Stk1 family PASTA domain-containing Ser/Thr kinase [Paenibacillus sp. CAA11]